MDITIGFLGLGLIGGSIAKGIKRHHKNYKLIAYNHHYETRGRRGDTCDIFKASSSNSFHNFFFTVQFFYQIN